MRHANRYWLYVLGAAMVAGAFGCRPPMSYAAGTPATDVVAGAWQHHKVTFDYFGITSLYTCDGLEEHVRAILLHLGARKDVHVTASGCPGPYNTPSRTAWVDADFYTLAPVAEAGGPDAVQARWTPLEVTPRRPNFMGGGDCELIQGMKDLITKNFSLRDMEYRTNCVPHEIMLDGFAVKGQALRALPPKINAVKG